MDSDSEETHWYSGKSASKSTTSTPTSSKFSSTTDARSWSVASSKPRKSEGDLGAMAVVVKGDGVRDVQLVERGGKGEERNV